MHSTTSSRPLRIARLALLLLGLLLTLTLLAGGAGAAAGDRVLLLQVDGTITPVMASYIDRGIADASKRGDAAVVLRMDTPGGLSSATDDIIRSILGSQVPVVVYIAPNGARAGSAGVYITYAAHIAAMAPSTNIGSATPIFLDSNGGASDDADSTLHRKVVNDAVAQIRGLAELRGRNADWAEQAVRQADNVTHRQALDLGVVDVVADDLPSLLRQIDGRTVTVAGGPATLKTADATVEPFEMSIGERILQVVSDPTIAYLMLSLGMLGLFLEFSNPGAILPGVAGAIFILLALFGLGNLEVGWAGIGLIAFAFLLFVIDLFVPSHGTLTLGGLVSFALGSIMLSHSFASPAVTIPTWAIVLVTATLGVFFVLIAGSVIRARLRPSTTGREGLIGEVGEVREELDPLGYVFADGELWHARSLAGRLAEGTPIRITSVDGLTVTVVPADQPIDAIVEDPAARSPLRQLRPRSRQNQSTRRTSEL